MKKLGHKGVKYTLKEPLIYIYIYLYIYIHVLSPAPKSNLSVHICELRDSQLSFVCFNFNFLQFNTIVNRLWYKSKFPTFKKRISKQMNKQVQIPRIPKF